ncbi:MtrB/PioB family decaheme-associated outer membrane protein [Nitrosomonas sp. Nm84]|uniref:MtrB/PioB family decaheme-associated outer membrane protein n=1 Tax=Nitrosomonas sp. Nm84 TaxID=200124 RepID=UPI000D7634C8|nr:MtrB/PioB family decaheme-associated outer membrane protein [Nitrosomonas sp. Nm84]PXW83877.1 MtrB/PioB family decaheme-associated outer membrane protein [Nitrosomonas sp. Nm84]
MNIRILKDKFPQSIIAVTLVLINAPAWSSDHDPIKELTKPKSTVNFGAGYLFNDNARFGQYTGLRNEGPYGIFNVDIVRRNDETGTWLKLLGRNLGLQNRDVRFEHNKQGNWGYFIDYSQTPRYEPFTVNTAVTGIGTADVHVPTSPTSGDPAQLKTERQSIGFGYNKFLPGNLEFQLHFRNEDKDGARLFGRGNRLGAPGPRAVGGFEFIPEPINSTIRQFGASLDYVGKQLQLSGGYYGTMYNNKNSVLNVTGGSDVGGIYAPSAFSPIALAPDNQSHQAFLAGGYNFTPSTRGTFKAAYTRATQTDSFSPTLFSAPGVGANLGGRIDTALLQAGLTARPLAKLSINTNFRFEDRDDKTPVLLYNPMATLLDLNGNSWHGFNNPRSFRTITSKFEASYALPKDFRLIGSIDHDHRDRGGFATNTSHRHRTDEISYRAELRRSLSETITGTIAYIHSDRFGSSFFTNTTGTGDPFFNLIAPFNLADRARDKIRLMANWDPIESLSLQLAIDESRDNYGHRAGSDLGLRKGSARNYSLDATYTFSEAWQATAWFSRNETHIDQTSRNPITDNGFREVWNANLQDIGTSFGLDINGKPTDKLETGASLLYSDFTNKFNQKVILDPQINTVPNISTQYGSLRLHAKYEMRKNLGLRLDYILDHFKTNEWTWNWRYTDGTKLTQDTNQMVSFVFLSAFYSWQ